MQMLLGDDAADLNATGLVGFGEGREASCTEQIPTSRVLESEADTATAGENRTVQRNGKTRHMK